MDALQVGNHHQILHGIEKMIQEKSRQKTSPTYHTEIAYAAVV